jgi:mono/diheme cytochrome c family protein
MIPPSMSRPVKVLFISAAAVVATALTTACGTEKISVPASNPNHAGAVLFNQRCSGCHTLSYAATHGSAANARNAEVVNGPNFDQRCERPVARVLYAIQNGGFSGAIMPQNVVVGQDAIEVAKFVATYSGRQAPKVPGVTPCKQQPIGTLPTTSAAATTATTTSTPGTTTSPATTVTSSQSSTKSGKSGKGKKQKSLGF